MSWGSKYNIFGKSITEFEENHYEAVLSERSLASTRPIN